MHIKHGESVIYVWLSKEEQQNESIIQKIEELKQQKRVVIFLSGSEGNQELIKNLMEENESTI